ncbi:MAG: NYN domain-containing protein [Firmicutes bacterium]|nr:NYN domain-containing protein [Bacillota bacterium]
MNDNTFLYQTQVLEGAEKAIVLVDFENISELIKCYGKNAMDIDFFPVIQKLIRSLGLVIIDFIVYSNFSRPEDNKTQASIRNLGISTRQSSNNGKNSSDLELTVDALRALHKNPSIGVFVIISSDRDIIPLLKAIRYEDKLSIVLSTKNGFNRIVAEYADFHVFIEDVFGFTGSPMEDIKPVNDFTEFLLEDEITEEMVERAKEVSKYFYNSHIWKKYQQTKEPIALAGYVNVIEKVLNRLKRQLYDDFKAAHCLGYVTIYTDAEKQRLYIREGEKKDEIYV